MIKAIDIETARRAWVAVMETSAEREAKEAYLRVLEQARAERKAAKRV